MGPDFEDFTITSENLRWLHACRWEGSHAEAFAEERVGFTHSFGKVPNLVKSKTQSSPTVSSRWILVGDDDNALAWAELQTFPQQMYKLGILIWGSVGKHAFEEVSLRRLISFCFIVGKFDHLKISAADQSHSKLLETYGESVGERKDTFGLTAKSWYPGSPGLTRIESLDLARDEWLNSPVSYDQSKDLQHIQLRIERFEKSQALLKPKKKKRGIIARFLRPKIDDPLF
jgi:hypothetical protein